MQLRSCMCGTVKDYETRGHRVARQDRSSPVAKRGREQREHVGDASQECNVECCTIPGHYADIQMGRRDDLVRAK